MDFINLKRLKLFCLLLATVIACTDHKNERALQTDENLSAFTDHQLSDAAIDSLVTSLKLPANESPGFWTKIINDSSYSAYHRVSCVFALLDRHFHSCTVSDFSQLLDNPAWQQEIIRKKWLPPNVTTDEVLQLNSLFVWYPFPDAHLEEYRMVGFELDSQYKVADIIERKPGSGSIKIKRIWLFGKNYNGKIKS